MRRAWILFMAVGALAARAQPIAANCYAPDRLGWQGPRGELGCQPCCGCRGPAYSMEWQYRDEDAGWSNQPVSSLVGRYTNAPFPALTHLARYCMRMRFVDDAGPGQWGPSDTPNCSATGSDVCFAWDNLAPTAPVLLDGGVVASSNLVELYFVPSSDDGGGVARYVFRYPGNIASVGGFGKSSTSPLSDVLGAGTWTVSLYAEDNAGNTSAPSGSLTVSLGFDASIAPPASPTWERLVTNGGYLNLVWPDDGADDWAVTQRGLDGGWLISARPRVSGPLAQLAVPGPCRFHAARLARVFGDQVSDWSPPSRDLLSDMVAPLSFPPQLASVDGGEALLSWTAATDSCPSGITYRLERSENGSAFLTRATTANTQAVDALDVTGVLRWRLVAIDGAGNLGTSDGGASLTVDAADGGLDDGGLDDGGLRDGGEISEEADPRRLSVGCGCDGGAASLLWLAIAVLRRRGRCRPVSC